MERKHMTVIMLMAGVAFLGTGLAANKLGPDFEPDELDLDLD